jgi:hypothetical protein
MSLLLPLLSTTRTCKGHVGLLYSEQLPNTRHHRQHKSSTRIRDSSCVCSALRLLPRGPLLPQLEPIARGALRVLMFGRTWLDSVGRIPERKDNASGQRQESRPRGTQAIPLRRSFLYTPQKYSAVSASKRPGTNCAASGTSAAGAFATPELDPVPFAMPADISDMIPTGPAAGPPRGRFDATSTMRGTSDASLRCTQYRDLDYTLLARSGRRGSNAPGVYPAPGRTVRHTRLRSLMRAAGVAPLPHDVRMMSDLVGHVCTAKPVSERLGRQYLSGPTSRQQTYEGSFVSARPQDYSRGPE